MNCSMCGMTFLNDVPSTWVICPHCDTPIRNPEVEDEIPISN